MSPRNWLRSWLLNSPRPAGRRSRLRLAVEPLEGRRVPAVLTFEDADSSGGLTTQMSTYGGLTWDGFDAIDRAALTGYQGGYTTGAVSGIMAASNNLGVDARKPGEIASQTPFTFNSAYLTAAFNDGLDVVVEGWRAGRLLYTTALTVGAESPTFHEFDYVGIDDLRFYSSGGIVSPFVTYGGHGDYVVIDDFDYTPSAPAGTFLVTNTADDGPGSLRQAISDANATPNVGGPDTIAFAIPGTGVHTIRPLSQLPTITDPVVVDGYTQSGASPNTNGPGLGDNAVLKIELDGSLAGPAAADFDEGNGLSITSGASTVRGLVINRFAGQGVILTANGGNTIEGNFIGTDPAGQSAEGNGDGGVLIGWYGGQSGGNTVGGLTPDARNVISGNGSVNVHVEPSDGNVIEGNFIGTDATGTAALNTAAGFRSGVFIFNGGNNVVGGTTPNARNLISGNQGFGAGVEISGNGNSVQGNYIGTDVTGSAGVANGTGVAAAGANLVGGTTPGAGNLISGNTGPGVSLVGSGLAQGNLIGTDVTGTTALGNGRGVVLDSLSTLGGTTPAARNVVSGNLGDGVFVAGGNNVVQGNYIGTDVTGTKALGNATGGGGVYVAFGNNDLIGGAAPGAGNVIAGNGYREVFVSNASTHVTVQGNYIGTDLSGNVPLGNPAWGFGVDIWDADNVQVLGNVIGDRPTGIGIEGTRSFDNTVQGNSIGGGADGHTAVPNGTGVRISGGATNNTIGGIISGNAYGVVVDTGGSATVTGGAITGNTNIGVYVTGGSATVSGGVVSGNHHGVFVSGGSATVTGGMISGNADVGVWVAGGTAAVAGGTISGNYTGVVVTSGTATVSGGLITGNTASGVYVPGGALAVTGGATSGNGDAGVYVAGGTAAVAGGTVSGNYTGVVVTGGTATVSDGAVTGNAAAGVYVAGGSAAVTGGTVSGNDHGLVVDGGAAAVTGGTVAGNIHNGVYVRGGSAAVTGGAISGNAAGVVVRGGSAAVYGNASITGNVNYGVYVYGSGSAAVSGGTVSSNPTGVRADGGSAAITGGTISGGSYGVQVTGGAATVSGGTISGNGTGVYVTAGTTSVSAGSITGNSYAGVRVDSGSVAVSGGTVSGNGRGILVDRGVATISGGAISGNTYVGVDVYGRGSAAIAGGTISGNSRGVEVDSGAATISGNTSVTGNVNYGVFVFGGSAVITGGTISGNGTGVSLFAGAAAVSGGSVSGGVTGVEVNGGSAKVSGGAISHNVIGVQVFGGSAAVSGGTISNNNAGVRTDGGSTTVSGDAYITGNVNGVIVAGGTATVSGGIISNSDTGVGIAGSGTAAVTGGTIVANAIGVAVDTGGSVAVSGGAIWGNDTGVQASGGSTFISGGTISGGSSGVVVGGGTATVTGNAVITNNSVNGVFLYGGSTFISGGSISGNGNGLGVSGGSVAVSGGSISGSDTGMFVYSGGAATVTGGTISGNSTGLVVDYGGSAAVGGVTFDGAADNGTDLWIGPAGAVTIGPGNRFGGDGYYIYNQSTAGYDLTADGTTFDLADPFRVEDRVYHRLDNPAVGLVRAVAGNLYVTAPGTGGSNETIQRAVAAAAAGDTVNIEAGTYPESVSTAGRAVTLAPGGAGVTARVTVTNLTLDSNATLTVDLNGTTAGDGYDQLAVTGTAKLGSAGLTAALGYAPAAGTAFAVIAGGTRSGAFARTAVAAGATGLVLTYTATTARLVVPTPGPLTATGAGAYRLVLNPNGPGAADDMIELYRGTALVGSQLYSAATAVTVTGAANSTDSLQLDYSRGVPVPAGTSGVTFNGGSGAGTDRVSVTGGAFAAVYFTQPTGFTGAKAAQLELDDMRVRFTDVEAAVDLKGVGAIDAASYLPAATATTVTLSQLATGETRLDATAVPALELKDPAGALGVGRTEYNSVVVGGTSAFVLPGALYLYGSSIAVNTQVSVGGIFSATALNTLTISAAATGSAVDLYASGVNTSAITGAGAAAVVRAAAGNLTLNTPNGGVNFGAGQLLAPAGNVTVTAAAGNNDTGAVSLLKVSASGAVTVTGGGAVTLQAGGSLAAGGAAAVTGTGTGAVTINSPVSGSSVTVRSAATTSAALATGGAGTLTATAGGVTLTSAGGVSLAGKVTTTGGNFASSGATFTTAAGADIVVSNGAAGSLTLAHSGAIQINAKLDARAYTVTGGVKTGITFRGGSRLVLHVDVHQPPVSPVFILASGTISFFPGSTLEVATTASGAAAPGTYNLIKATTGSVTGFTLATKAATGPAASVVSLLQTGGNTIGVRVV